MFENYKRNFDIVSKEPWFIAMQLIPQIIVYEKS